MQAARDQRFQLTGRMVLVGWCNAWHACSDALTRLTVPPFCVAGWPGRIPACRQNVCLGEDVFGYRLSTLNNLMQAHPTHVDRSS